MTNLCPATSRSNFPHHWKCLETAGHLSTECKEKGCTSEYSFCTKGSCPVPVAYPGDNGRRCPDNSMVAKSQLQQGKIVLASYNLNSKPLSGPDEILIISDTK
jgi:hypothetical protein